MYDAILVPVDGTPCSDEAVAHAVGLAKLTRSRVIFLFVADTMSGFEEGVHGIPEVRAKLTDRGRAVLAAAQQVGQDGGVATAIEMTEGTPADAIVERANDFDLIVLGSHRKGLWQRIAVGSVTEAVLHRTTRPLLIVSKVAPSSTDP